MKASDFQNQVLSRLATVEQKLVTLESTLGGDDGLHAFKREVKESFKEEHERTTEAHKRINEVDKKLIWITAIGTCIGMGAQYAIKWMEK